MFFQVQAWAPGPTPARAPPVPRHDRCARVTGNFGWRASVCLVVRPVLGSSAPEQGLALLQMVCEVLRVPFRRDVVDRMLRGMVGNRPYPSLVTPGPIYFALCRYAWLVLWPAPFQVGAGTV